jgi:hypothetical protein
VGVDGTGAGAAGFPRKCLWGQLAVPCCAAQLLAAPAPRRPPPPAPPPSCWLPLCRRQGDRVEGDKVLSSALEWLPHGSEMPEETSCRCGAQGAALRCGPACPRRTGAVLRRVRRRGSQQAPAEPQEPPSYHPLREAGGGGCSAMLLAASCPPPLPPSLACSAKAPTRWPEALLAVCHGLPAGLGSQPGAPRLLCPQVCVQRPERHVQPAAAASARRHPAGQAGAGAGHRAGGALHQRHRQGPRKVVARGHRLVHAAARGASAAGEGATARPPTHTHSGLQAAAAWRVQRSAGPQKAPGEAARPRAPPAAPAFPLALALTHRLGQGLGRWRPVPWACCSPRRRLGC